MFSGNFFGIRQQTLNSTCAKFVQVIHTSRILGTFERLGDSDFFANEHVKQQPGCSSYMSSCSHNRAFELYFASLFSQYAFIGVDNTTINGIIRSRMGFFNDRTPGRFSIETTGCFGYAFDNLFNLLK